MRRTRADLRAVIAILLAVLVVAAVAEMLVGRGDLADERLRGVFLSLRGARLAGAALAGAALAVAGVLVQGLFRNPLASPSVLGTTAGATLGGKLALLLASPALAAFDALTPEMVLPVGCVLGSLASLMILLGFVRRDTSLVTLLLVGFVLSALFMSFGGFLTALAQDSWELGRALVAFSLGGLGGTGRAQVFFALPLVLGAILVAFGWSRTLDVLLSGESEAMSLGVDVLSVTRWMSVWIAVLVGAAVSLGGNIGFVGLVVPHALRPYTGAEHARLLPAAAIAGAGFLVTCDAIARAVPARTEVPLGVVTGLVGAPVFLYLLLRAQREGRLV